MSPVQAGKGARGHQISDLAKQPPPPPPVLPSSMGMLLTSMSTIYFGYTRAPQAQLHRERDQALRQSLLPGD